MSDHAEKVDTPRCNALESNALDSFDIRAWRLLAYSLERELRTPPSADERQRAIEEAVQRVVWFDWSDNDSDAVAAMESLRALSSAPKAG